MSLPPVLKALIPHHTGPLVPGTDNDVFASIAVHIYEQRCRWLSLNEGYRKVQVVTTEM
jgi:hypothetical protein